jgi:hypothetical protein
MKKHSKIIIVLLALAGCSKEKYFDGPEYYSDGFESYTLLSDLLPDDDKNWSYTQITKAENSITVDTSIKHGGNKSLRFYAAKSNSESLSKCSIAKQNMAFWEGETLRLTAWYYLSGTNKLEWLFLMDMEEQTAIGAGPGMRLALVDNKLRVEYKFNERDIIQEAGKEIDFPRNEWVEIIWEVKLSQKNKGTVKLWQNNQLLIDSKNNVTLPKDVLYSLQGTKGMYSSMEFGITANSYDNDLLLYVDDIVIEKR